MEKTFGEDTIFGRTTQKTWTHHSISRYSPLLELPNAAPGFQYRSFNMGDEMPLSWVWVVDVQVLDKIMVELWDAMDFMEMWYAGMLGIQYMIIMYMYVYIYICFELNFLAIENLHLNYGYVDGISCGVRWICLTFGWA